MKDQVTQVRFYYYFDGVELDHFVAVCIFTVICIGVSVYILRLFRRDSNG